MLTITLQVDAPVGQAVGVKEDVAMYCERFGDVLAVSVAEDAPEQLGLAGIAPGAARSRPAAPTRAAGQAPSGRTGKSPPSIMACCLTCAQYQAAPGGEDGRLYYGKCRGSGKPVHDLGRRCGRWRSREGL